VKIAVIPARGGSKRIPRKNVKLFCGKPIIAWSIEAALQSACFEHVVVSTDDTEIADTARRCGATTPFVRPAALSDDHATTAAVVCHVIEWYAAHGVAPQHVCCIYATAPFVTAVDLKHGLHILEQSGASYAFSVTHYAFPIQRALRLDRDNRVSMFQPEHSQTRSQDLEPAFHDAAQFYWGRTQAWLDRKEMFSSASAPVVLPRTRVQDIDTPEDWEQAELMFRLQHAAASKVPAP
jgi:pseudaminic acid cytidylyltransferase